MCSGACMASAQHRSERLLATVIDELLGAAVLAPLYEIDCKAPVHPQFFATDATETEAAAVVEETVSGRAGLAVGSSSEAWWLCQALCGQ